MFQNKHIIRASFVALFLAIIASILFYRYFTIQNVIVETITQENKKIVSYYLNNIWNIQSNATKVIKYNDIQTAVKDKAFLNFSKETLDYLKKFDKTKISILNKRGEEFISTTRFTLQECNVTSFFQTIDTMLDQYLFRIFPYERLVRGVYKGAQPNKILLNYTLTNNLDDNSRVYLVSLFPIIDSSSSSFSVQGSIVVITDITTQWDKIKYFEIRVSIFLLTVFLLFFVVIIFNTNHAQKVIDQQVVNNRLLEEAKIKAESENYAKGEFLANVSHELRTPLNAIIGFSEVILTEAYGKLEHPQYLEYIQDINNSGKHLLSVINDILDFSKASADKLKVDIIEVDATKLASSSLRFVKPRADEAKVVLIEKLPPEHIVIKADPKRLKQALLNLLSNSVKFTPENGSVTLELEKNIQDKLVYIRVVDTGIGMEEKDIPKALTSFGQIDTKLSRKYEGTGLGLPLTKKLVELMNGKFEITSKIGIGTTVTISFKYEDL